MRDPVHDEAIQAELDSLGLRHFLDIRATVRLMLEGMPGTRRAAFGACIAERLVREQEGLPEQERSAYVTHWRPALDVIWAGLARPGDGHESAGEVAKAIGCFYLSGAYQDRRHNDPADAADNAAMAALYAAECYLHGSADFAAWAGWRGFDAAAVVAAADQEWPHRRPSTVTLPAWELAHPCIQTELDLQLAALELLGERFSDDHRPPDGELLAQLREQDYSAAT